MKIIGNIILVVIIIVASAYAGRNILIKNAVNSGGSKILGTDVNVDSVDFSPFAGTFQIKGFSVANPDGFSAGNALYLGEINIKLDPKSILTKTVQIEEIRISQPEINIVGKLNDTNLTRLQKNISSSAPAKPSSSTEVSTEAKEHAGHECKSVAIRYFSLDSGKVTASFAGLADSAKINLPTIELHNIGQDSSTNLHQAIQMMFREIIKVAQKTALSGAGFSGQMENIKSDLEEKTKGLKEDLSKKLKSFGF